jgi:hypothetical protein
MAKTFGEGFPRMTNDHGLHIEVQDGEITVSLPHTHFAVTYVKLGGTSDLQLHATSWLTIPTRCHQLRRRAPMDPAPLSSQRRVRLPAPREPSHQVKVGVPNTGPLHLPLRFRWLP